MMLLGDPTSFPGDPTSFPGDPTSFPGGSTTFPMGSTTFLGVLLLSVEALGYYSLWGLQLFLAVLLLSLRQTAMDQVKLRICIHKSAKACEADRTVAAEERRLASRSPLCPLSQMQSNLPCNDRPFQPSAQPHTTQP